MNVIFLDFDGVLDTIHYKDNSDVESKIKILSEICKENNCKVVIEAAAKIAIDEETMEVDENSEWVNFIFDMFKKYNIECIGRTPDVKKYIDSDRHGYTPMWKEDEIRLYLYRHPEIEHYCVIDDDDLGSFNSDLNKVRNHLVKTIFYSKYLFKEEGLLEKHKPLVKEILKKENEVRKLILKYGDKYKKN